MPNDDDRDLRALFQRQRQKDRAAGPAFERVIAGTRRPEAPRGRIRPRFAMAAAATVVLVAGTLAVLQERGLTGDRRAGLLLSGLTTSVWRAPTDFLLDMPQSDLTRTVPTFGVPLRGLTPREEISPERLKTPRTGRGNS
jgi:hypothetical protein